MDSIFASNMCILEMFRKKHNPGAIGTVGCELGGRDRVCKDSKVRELSVFKRLKGSATGEG